MKPFNLLGALPAVRTRATTPALIIHGREDPIPLASSVAAAQALGAQLVTIDDCGHVPYVERPEPLFAALEQYLAQGAAAGGGPPGHTATEVRI